MITRRKLPLSALRSFEATARHLSMKDAAAELGVTPGAISQQVRALESLLQVELLIRKHRHLELTSAGEHLFRTLMRNFDEIEQTLATMATKPDSRRIRLKLVPSLAIRWLVPRLAAFHGLHPELDVEVATGAPMEIRFLEEVDFASQVGHGHWPGCVAIRLFPDAFLPVCAPSMRNMFTEPADLLKAPLLHSMMRMEAWQIWFEYHGLTHSTVSSTSSIKFANAALAYEAAAQGLGVAIAQYAYIAHDLATGKLYSPFPQPVYTGCSYYLISSRARAQLPKNQLFAAWIKTLCPQEAQSRSFNMKFE